MRIALLIPCTSKNRDNWKSMKDTYLYNFSLKTFLYTYDSEHEYCFYIGYDKDDRIFSNKKEQDIIHRFSNVFKNVSFQFIELNVEKGFLTKMWNILFKKAYDDNYDYFYQTGDDINFKTKGWVNECIHKLKEHNNVGLTGPLNNNARILTQAMVSRKHMDIFGWFFPEEIKNWCCDDWYNMVYSPKYLYVLKNHYCSNDGGQPRYVINNDIHYTKKINENTIKLRNFTFQLASKHKKFIENFLHV
jgi:hypothetical protein